MPMFSSLESANVILCGRETLQMCLKLRMLKWEIILDCSSGPSLITCVLKSREAFPAILRKMWPQKNGQSSSAGLLSLKTEESRHSAIRNWKRQGKEFSLRICRKEFSPAYTLTLAQWCCCSVTKSWPTLHNPTDCSTPGFPVPHHLTVCQVHVHCIDDATQPSHPLSPSSPSAINGIHQPNDTGVWFLNYRPVTE